MNLEEKLFEASTACYEKALEIINSHGACITDKTRPVAQLLNQIGQSALEFGKATSAFVQVIAMVEARLSASGQVPYSTEEVSVIFA